MTVHFSRVCAVVVLIMAAGCGEGCPALTEYELPAGFLLMSENNRLQISSPDFLIHGALFKCEDSEEVCGEILDLRTGEIRGFRYGGSTFPDTLRATERPGGDVVRFTTNLAVPIVRDLAQTVVNMHCAATAVQN